MGKSPIYQSLYHNVKTDAILKTYNENFVDWWKQRPVINGSVCVFIDPPWGGPGYKEREVINDIYLESDNKRKYGCLDLINLMKSGINVDLAVFKLPFNFNLKLFNENIKDFYMYGIKKANYVLINIRKLRNNKKRKAIYIINNNPKKRRIIKRREKI